MSQDQDVTYEKAFDFAVKVVEQARTLSQKEKEFVMSRQLLKSGTSIGANVAESKGSISKAEYSMKVGIAYKECLETKFWLRLLLRTNYLPLNKFNELFQDADELGRILYAILRTTGRK